MQEMNKVISWAVTALLNEDNHLPDDKNFRLALQLAGMPKDEINAGIIEFGKSPLESIFSRVSLDLQNKSGTHEKWIPWQILDANNMPIPEEQKPQSIQFKIVEDKKVFEAIKQDENIALAFLEKYGTYLSASAEKSFLPFYETVRIAAAIYASMESNGWKSNFRVIGAALNGIQNYIFDLSEGNSKGVAKLLRARSFYVGLFLRLALHFLLDTMKLPKYCIVIDAGGRALILTPDNNETRNLFKTAKNEIDAFCLSNFYGELSLNLSDKITLCETDFKSVNLISIIEAVNCDLEDEKNKSFNSMIMQDNWQTEMFIMNLDYQKYSDNGLCVATEKFPKEKNVKYENMSRLCH